MKYHLLFSKTHSKCGLRAIARNLAGSISKDNFIATYKLDPANCCKNCAVLLGLVAKTLPRLHYSLGKYVSYGPAVVVCGRTIWLDKNWTRDVAEFKKSNRACLKCAEKAKIDLKPFVPVPSGNGSYTKLEPGCYRVAILADSVTFEKLPKEKTYAEGVEEGRKQMRKEIIEATNNAT